jgi:hypothetical protein
MAPVRPVLHQLSCSNEMVRNAPKHEFWVKQSGSCALKAIVRLVLHRLSCCNKMVRNCPKHEFWVEWSGFGAFVVKNFKATSFSELVR